MRFGAPIFDEYKNAEEWALIHKEYSYNAAYCPIGADCLDLKDAYITAAKNHDIIIAEVGAWSNPISLNVDERKKAIAHCKTQLHLADEIGANCCVNIAGNLGEVWDGHSPDNFTKKAFDLIVETTRDIIDSVNPGRTFYTLEMMPWMYPYDEDSYLDLIRAIDRKQFAVHLDIVNIINSPLKYYNTPGIIKSCFAKLGGYIKSVHVKDMIMTQEMTTHITEVICGEGNFCHKTLIEEVKKCDENIPLMLEHLPSKEDYIKAGEYLTKLL